MKGKLAAIAAITVLGLGVARAAEGPPAAPAAPPAPLATPNPHYISIVQEIAVDRPAAQVWARVGGFCVISEYLNAPCSIASGKDGELGAVRALNGGNVLEVLVGKTALSYTYTQPVRVGAPYNLYHGTVEAQPVTATTSKLIYSLVFDNSMLADDAARTADRDRRATRFATALKNMKTLAEGGKIAP